jgi:hypothetical protein
MHRSELRIRFFNVVRFVQGFYFSTITRVGPPARPSGDLGR